MNTTYQPFISFKKMVNLTFDNDREIAGYSYYRYNSSESRSVKILFRNDLQTRKLDKTASNDTHRIERIRNSMISLTKMTLQKEIHPELSIRKDSRYANIHF